MNEILLTLLFVGIATVYFILQRRKIADGKAMFWATVSEPIHYVSDDPDDDAVTSRAANAREKMKAHGNVYLRFDSEDPKNDDIWVYVYGATPETPTRDFSQWQDWAQMDILKRREAWRQQKANWSPDAARQVFSGQKN